MSHQNTNTKINESVTVRIYQCNECWKIISDSTFLVKSGDDFPALVLEDVTDNVHREGKKRVSSRKFDKDSYEVGRGQKRPQNEDSMSPSEDDPVKIAIEKLQDTVVFLHNRLKAIEDCLSIEKST